MNVRRLIAPSLVVLGAALCLTGCSGLGARILSVGQSVDVEGLTVTYLGSVAEDAMLSGTKLGNEGYPASDTTEYVRFVFEVANPSDAEVRAKDLLPASFVYGTGEETEEAFPTPGYLSKDADGGADMAIAPGATEQVSLVVEVPTAQAEDPELLTTTLDLDGQAYEIRGDTIEQGGDFQETTQGVAEDFAELLMTRYQDFVHTAEAEVLEDPPTAYETIRDAAETSAAAIQIYDDELSSMETPALYADTAAPLQSLLDRFETYFSKLADIDPDDPEACEKTVDSLNRELEEELPDFREDAETAMVNMPYLEGTNFDNLIAYFDDLANYDVNAVEPLVDPNL